MNVFIVAVCVNLLLTLVNAQNIHFDTLVRTLKSNPRRSGGGYSNNVEISDPDEVIPILPGFYLEKPKDLSKSLFKNPRAWPDDIYAILEKEEAERKKSKVNVNFKIKTSEDDKYVQRKIIKAVEDIKRFRANQKQKSDEKFKTLHIDSENAQKVPVKKLLARVFHGMDNSMDHKRRQRSRKPKKNTGSNTNKILGDILSKLLNGNLNKQPYKKMVQLKYVKREEGRSKEKLLGNILNAIQNKKSGHKSKTYPRPTMVIISRTSLDNDDYEVENNAREETSEEDYGSPDLLKLNTRRLNKKEDDPDIGSTKYSSSSVSAESGSSDYERNPGNPFTVHKNKYKQNWPYNHFMDGDHMNINPFGPQFGSLGPSGPELFFGRKWWYFNQDDFKPMG